MTQARISWLLGAASLFIAGAATAQSLPCASVSPEVREYVRQRGACRDVKAAPRPKASPRPNTTVADNPTPAQPFALPDVVGRSDADAASTLGNFKVERNEVANAAPKGEVVAQEPAPTTLAPRGSTVILQVSDGSLAASSTVPGAAPVTAAAASSTAPATGATPALTAAPMPPVPTDPQEARDRLSTALSTNAALIFGAGVLLGLFAGAVLMRERLLGRRVALDQPAEISVMPAKQPVQLQPVELPLVAQRSVEQRSVNRRPIAQPTVEHQLLDQQPVEQALLDQQAVDEHPVEHALLDQQPVDDEPIEHALLDQPAVGEQPVHQPMADQQPAGIDAGRVTEPSAPFEVRFAARFVSVETTIALAPFAELEEIAVDTSEHRHA